MSFKPGDRVVSQRGGHYTVRSVPAPGKIELAGLLFKNIPYNAAGFTLHNPVHHGEWRGPVPRECS